jgi:hypothetical protein
VKAFKQLWITAVLLLPLGYGSAAAQTKNPVDDLSKARPTLTDSTEAYKASTRELVRLQQEEVDKTDKKLEELRHLVADGVVARNELAVAERDMAAMREKLAAAKQQVANADRLIAEIQASERLKESQAQAVLPKATSGSKLKLTSFRYSGSGSWSINNLQEIRSFFAGKFGRALPTSAIGQSATHNQLRWDHRNSADVSLHPDSVEGKALINYLQGQGIPFLAFRSAIPGVATGPNIHIGLPSNRLM